MKKYKKLSIFFLIVMLIGLSIVLLLPKNIDNKTYYKNLKELNYNVTYKDAFPSKTLRYAILRCVVENICNNVDEELKNSNIRQYRGNSNLVIKNEGFKQEIIAKENEVLNKADLDKIQMLYIKETSPQAVNRIASLRGIEFLPNLRMFYSDSIITPEVNLSFNHNLEYFYFQVDNLIEGDCNINLGTISNLKKFYFDISGPRNIGNNKSLDFSNNLSLKDVTVRTCGLTNVNIANNVLLENVDFSNNDLYNLNLNYNPNLKSLGLFKNNISNLNLSNVPNLESLDLNWNLSQLPNFHQVPKLKSLHLGGGRYSSLDLSILPLLEEFYVQERYGYTINNLNINNPTLKKLSIHSTNIVNLNLINAPNLEELTVSQNKQLVGLNVDNNIKLKKISLNQNNFSSINLNNNRELEDLAIYGNDFNNIDLRNNDKLKSLQIIKTNISTINLENNPNLTYLNLSQNNLTSLDLHNNNLLRQLDVKNNNLESLILNAQTLTSINASNNKLSSLNLNNIGGIAGNINLKNNKLTNLDLRNFSQVYDLDVSDNLLKELYLPNNIYRCDNIKYSNNKLMRTEKCGYGQTPQNIEIEVIKNKEAIIPILYNPLDINYYNGQLVENNELFTKTANQKYIFKKTGTYTIDFNLYLYMRYYYTNNLIGKGGTVTVTVKSGEEDLFNPVISNLRTMEGYKATFTKEDYKNAISNLPTNIKKFEVDVNQLDTRVPGTKNIVTKITFSDDTEKEVVVPVEVEELTKEKYNPEIITKTVPRTTEITEEEYKKLITNLPNNIQRIDVVKKADTTVVGSHEAILNVVLRNGDIKEVKIPVIVSSIMADSFEPVYSEYFSYIGIYYSLNNNIVNLPKVGSKESYYYIIDPITKLRMSEEQLKEAVSTKGLKNFKIKIFFPDNSSKEYDMPMTIYERKTINVDDVVFTPKNEEHIDYNNNKILITKHRHNVPKPYCNNETFECFGYNPDRYDYSATNIDGAITGPKGGIWFEYDKDQFVANTKRFNPGASKEADRPWDESYNNPSWGRTEEKRVVEITGTKGEKNKLVQTVTILRDTDHDGIPDIDDEDDDNDGISDEQEVLDQTDPKDSTSFKVTKICYKINA